MNDISANFSVWFSGYISILVVIVMWQQLKAAREQLRFDLFKKRFKIYESVLDFIASGCSGKMGAPEILDFDRARNKSLFLFAKDKGIHDYLLGLRERALDYDKLKSDMEATEARSPERSQVVEKMVKIKTWFLEQDDEARKKFEGYLSFKK
jgi:hypothetical protein